MGTAFLCVYAVDISEHRLVVAIVILHANFYLDFIASTQEINHIFMYYGLVFIEIFYELLKASFEVEFDSFGLRKPFIYKGYLYALIQEGKFS